MTLTSAIETLYETFARYPVGATVLGCPCCVDQKHGRVLASSPLRAIPDEVLERYAFKAMTTWGSEDDFKHFLPAIWERMTTVRFGVDAQTVYGKLPYAEWARWPERERAAVVGVTHAWLDAVLDRGSWEIGDVVECAGLCGIPIAPLVELLELSEGPAAATAISTLVRYGVGARAWWHDDHERLLHTWVSERAAAKLEAAFFAFPDHSDAGEWSDALQHRSG